MKKLVLISLSALLLAACGGSDDPAPSGSGARNTNSNALLIKNGSAQAVTEDVTTTDCQRVAMRMEMPRLQGGSNNLFVVHTVGTYGVNYCMEYDCTLRASRWSAYQWHKGFNHKDANWNKNNWKNTDWGDYPFQPDPIIPVAYRTTLQDHRSNGHDRGHMLASADRLNSKDANEQTFYLSNIHPQLNSFNAQGIWYNLEIKLRNDYDTDKFRDTLYVVKGGTIAKGQYDMVRGSGNQLACPRYFFMALLCKKSTDPTQGGYKAIGFWMPHEPNTSTNYKAYAVSIDELERKSGIDFFCNLPDDIEQQVESNLVLAAWKIN